MCQWVMPVFLKRKISFFMHNSNMSHCHGGPFQCLVCFDSESESEIAWETVTYTASTNYKNTTSFLLLVGTLKCNQSQAIGQPEIECIFATFWLERWFGHGSRKLDSDSEYHHRRDRMSQGPCQSRSSWTAWGFKVQSSTLLQLQVQVEAWISARGPTPTHPFPSCPPFPQPFIISLMFGVLLHKIFSKPTWRLLATRRPHLGLFHCLTES